MVSNSSRTKGVFLNGNLGIKINRPSAADAAGWVSIFTINGGLIQITGLYAIVTVLHAGAACQVQFRHSAGPTVLNVATAAVATPVGTVVTVTGDPADNAIIGLGTGVLNTFVPLQGGMKGSPTTGIQEMGLVCGVGTIDVDWTVSTAGSTRYVLTYIPIDNQSHVFWV
jgi:hypothetical protein